MTSPARAKVFRTRLLPTLQPKNAPLTPTLRTALTQLLTTNQRFVDKLSAVVVDQRNKISVRRGFTGSFAGGSNHGTYKVRISGANYFLKLSMDNPQALLRRYKRAHQLLAQAHNTIGECNVRILMPHAVYRAQVRDTAGKKVQRTFVLTDYFEKSHGKPLAAFGNHQVYERLENAAYLLERLLEKAGSTEERNRNLFYAPRTNTLVVYDI